MHVNEKRTVDGKEPEEKNVWLFNIAADCIEEHDLSDEEPEKVVELLHSVA